MWYFPEEYGLATMCATQFSIKQAGRLVGHYGLFIVKLLFTLLCINSSNLIENYYNFVFFDYKVSTQLHFESCLV